MYIYIYKYIEYNVKYIFYYFISSRCPLLILFITPLLYIYSLTRFHQPASIKHGDGHATELAHEFERLRAQERESFGAAAFAGSATIRKALVAHWAWV